MPITCTFDTIGKYDIHATLIEHDYITANEEIIEVQNIYTKPDIVLEINATYGDRDGLWDLIYEFRVNLLHNCTGTGKFRKLQIDLEDMMPDVICRVWYSKCIYDTKRVYLPY